MQLKSGARRLDQPPRFCFGEGIHAPELVCCCIAEQCQRDDVRIVDRQTQSIGVLWQTEQPVLRPLPGRPFDCCVTRQVHLTPYSQITYEINRYSAPVEQARRELVLKAYPFHIEILSEHRVLA